MNRNEYMREYMLARYYRRRGEAVVQLGGRCVDCGGSDSLEFDHDDASTKTYDIGKLFSSGGETKLQAELRKCVLRCSECHKRKTEAAGDRPILAVPHGGGASGKKNCPCLPCRNRKAEYMKDYQASRA